nr:hypothetical protein [Tanacetum cinerariifolium]
MESVFHISGCAVENQVKFVTCTMLDDVLTWWNGHRFQELALMCTKFLSDETEKVDNYISGNHTKDLNLCALSETITIMESVHPSEIKKLEIELWNLKVKGNDVGGYTQRFQELALMCTKFLSDETEKVDNYISRNHTKDLNLCALSETITIMESVHPSAPTARKSGFSVLKNQGTEARGMVYALGGGETNQDLDNTMDDMNA